MDWKSRIRESINQSGVVLDEDVIEELSIHAATFYQAKRADGCDKLEAERHVLELIDSWRAVAPNLRRRANHAVAVEAPTIAPRRLAGLFNDVRYAFRVLNRQRAFAAL